MHIGRSYKLSEFLIWTIRNIFWLIVIGTIPTVLYQEFGLKWLAIPWVVISLLGTATAFIVGFKNIQTYNRTWEARDIWGTCMSSSRAWATMCIDFLNNKERSKDLIYRHLAWLTALRYQLRVNKTWETATLNYNRVHHKYFTVPERESPVEEELAKYLSEDELKHILTTKNRAAQLLRLQASDVKKLYGEESFNDSKFFEMHKTVREFFAIQGRTEKIKNFPFPRQYATITAILVKFFCFLLPFGMLEEFDKLNNENLGFLNGNMVWLVIPFSVLISWVFSTLRRVGESTENPFEGNANDVPISEMSRIVEIDLREMLGEKDLPEALQPQNNIIL
jgi:ion channel-forming bestrophin family protein